MCLSQVVRLDQVDAEHARAVGHIDGRAINVSLAVLTLDGDLPAPGDWVQVTTGLAVRCLTDDEAAQILTARSALPGGTGESTVEKR